MGDIAPQAQMVYRPMMSQSETDTTIKDNGINIEAPEMADLCDDDDLRTVLVGPKKRPFTIHSHYLTRSSKYMQAACKSVWGVPSRTVNIPETNPMLFAIYLRWLHTQGDVLDEDLPFTAVAVPGVDLHANSYTTLVSLELMAIFLMDDDFGAKVVSEIHDKGVRILAWDVKIAVFAYENLPRKSRLCKMLCRLLAQADAKDLPCVISDLPKELLEDMNVEMAKNIAWLRALTRRG